MSNITVKIAERTDGGVDISVVKEYRISDLNINRKSTRNEVFKELGMNPKANHFITEIDWDDVEPSTHENNAMYLMNVVNALKWLCANY